MDKGFVFNTEQEAEDFQQELYYRTVMDGTRFATVMQKYQQEQWFFVMNTSFNDILTEAETAALVVIDDTFYKPLIPN